MTKKPDEYEFWIVCSGRGELPKGQKVGFISIKSKSSDIEELKKKAYEKLAPQMSCDPRFFDLFRKDFEKGLDSDKASA